MLFSHKNVIIMKFKTHMLLLSRTLIGLILILWPQLSINSAQANCPSHSPKPLKVMNRTELLIINESLIIEDIKKAYKALATHGGDSRTIALQFGTIDTASPSENEVRPFNPDVQSMFVYDDLINFYFRPHSLISLSALQKAFGNYTIAPTRTNRTGSTTTYTIVFRVDLNGRNTRIIVERISPDLTAEKIEITGVSVAY
jgi:hypothetical protein